MRRGGKKGKLADGGGGQLPSGNDELSSWSNQRCESYLKTWMFSLESTVGAGGARCGAGRLRSRHSALGRGRL